MCAVELTGGKDGRRGGGTRTASSPIAPLVSGGVPVLGHLPAFLTDAISVFRRGYIEHGRIFRLNLSGIGMVVLLDPEHRRRLLSSPEEDLSIAASYPFLKSMFGSDFFFMAEPAEYRRQRELFVPVFRGAALRDYVAVMEGHTRRLIHRMGEKGELELVRTCGELNLQITADTYFGPELGPRIGRRLDLFEDFSANVSFLLPPSLRPLRSRRSRAARAGLHAIVREFMAHRRAHPLASPDFLQTLCESRYPDGRQVPDSAIIDQALGLIWASRETTAGQLAWALADLLVHPECHPGILSELRRLDPERPLTVEDLHRMEYTDHVLHESERLHPMATLIARRATRDQELGGCRIPRGTMVLTSPYLTHRLPEDFPDPEAFRPGRYRDDPQAVQRLLGFGAGIHRCLGQRFARLETKVVTTLLLRHYHMELLDSPVPISGLSPRGVTAPCRVRYRARSAVNRTGR